MSRLGGQQPALRLVVLGTPLLAVAAEHEGGAEVQSWYVVAVAAAALVTALLPDSHTGLLVVLGIGGHWSTSATESLGVWVLLVALLLLVFHVACLLTAYGPPSVVLEADLVLAWLPRCALCVAVTALVWLVARILSGLQLPESALLYGAGLLLVTGWCVLLTRLATRRAG